MRISDWSSDGCSSALTLADEGRPRVRHQVANEPVDRAAVQAAGDRGEAALDQVGLVRRQDEAALPADQPRDEVEFLRRHRSAPPAIRASRGPISDIPTISLRSEEHTSELQSLMRISYAVFCLKKKK